MGDDHKRFGAPTALSRRNLFEFAGLGFLAAAAPGNKLLASPPGNAVGTHRSPSPVMERLSAYMSEAATRALPDEVAERTKVALPDKTVTFASVHDNARLTDPRTLRARAKIRLIPDEELQSLMPLRAAIVDVRLVDGTHLSRRIDDVRGTLNNPMTRAEIVAKASDLIAPILGPVKCASLIERIFQLDSVRGIRDLRPLLQRG
jgi:MmgE/PrpD C-terminal domain